MNDWDSTLERVEARALTPVGPAARAAIERSPDPTRAAVHLERWLAASSNPSMFLGLLNSGGRPLDGVVRLLASSHQVADILAQNPELGSLFFEPVSPPSADGLRQEGLRLLEVAHSTAHRLDRLRLMKQRWTLRVAFADVNEIWPTPVVLRALSDLADGLIRLVVESLWPTFASEKGLPERCPLQIVALGKLGGHEVNYSSDVDLVHALPDDTDASAEKAITRFCALVGRSLEEQMGRGMLYRVDLRLRPFGGAGPIVQRLRAIEAYYESHAETWEHMALIRSRVIVGDCGERWERLRQMTAFGKERGAWQMQELLRQRARIEQLTDASDLKRGEGGIRDIEFLTQMHQMLFGRRSGNLDQLETAQALSQLGQQGYLPDDEAGFLAEAYLWLRSVEHRLQLEGNQQTHRVPSKASDLQRLARSLGFPSATEFTSHLSKIRARVRELYNQRVGPFQSLETGLPLSARAGSVAGLVEKWLNTLDATGGFCEAAMQSEGGIERMARVAEAAPALLPLLSSQLALSEAVITGEIEEEHQARDAIARAPKLGDAVIRHRARAAVRWCLNPDHSLSVALDAITDAALQRLLGGLPLEAVALGSLGAHESGWTSDADLVLFCPEGVRHLEAEQAAQGFLKQVQDLKTEGVSLSVDLRLRPDGKSGLLARTYEGFRAYIRDGLDPWEQVACGRARLIQGNRHTLGMMREATMARPWSRELAAELLSVKRRLETELAPAPARERHLKHGPGGLEDLAWFCQLHLLAHPEAWSLASVTTTNRLKDLLRAGLITESEFETLAKAHRLQMEARWWIGLKGLPADVLPIGLMSLTEATTESRRQARAIYESKIARLAD